METLEPTRIVAPFSKINLWRRPDGTVKVRCYIAVERPFENAKTGLALDGSASMRPAYGFASGIRGALLSGSRRGLNQVAVAARSLCAFLSRTVDVAGRTAVIYWGTGPSSAAIQVVGDLDQHESATHDFAGPRTFGGGETSLLGAVRHFVERFAGAPWGMYVFLSDGFISDLEAVKRYSRDLCRDIAAGRRAPVKLVLIGVGEEVDEGQMSSLDDLDSGTDVDLWDHKIAREMARPEEIFAEVVDATMIIADAGRVCDARGVLVHDYRDTGLPALLELDLPAGSADAFILEYGGQVIRQPLA